MFFSHNNCLLRFSKEVKRIYIRRASMSYIKLIKLYIRTNIKIHLGFWVKKPRKLTEAYKKLKSRGNTRIM
jgi:hypothetical protein